jgi:hypothetical protein
MLKAIGWTLATVAGIFILMMIYGAVTMTPEKSAWYDKKDRAEKMCDQMIGDSALGSERRMTRDICDKLKAQIEAEKPR